jgi:hypothetical protein
MTPDLAAKARALAEAVLLPLTDSHVNLHPAVPVARALLAALDAEPQRLDRERLDFGEGFYVCVKCWKVSPVPRVCFCGCNANDGKTIVEVTRASILSRLEADRGK